jgi:regulator of cell morphogenesis and NO signaling
MKLADLIHADYKLLFVFPRFGISFGLGEHTVRQTCERKQISLPLFLLVCNVYACKEYRPGKHALDDIPLEDLIRYLRNSHVDYLQKRIPRLSADILAAIPDPHKKMFGKFCEKYTTEVAAHLEYEEKVVFPYITSILRGNRSGNYRIETFEDNHSDIEESLTDLKNILIKYLPEGTASEEIRKILFDIFFLEDDLNKHTLLENTIMVSLVERIERSIEQ